MAKMNGKMLAYAVALSGRENRVSTVFLLFMLVSSVIGSYFRSERPELATVSLFVACLAAAGLLYARLKARIDLRETERTGVSNQPSSHGFGRIRGYVAIWMGIPLGLTVVGVAAYAGGVVYTGNFDAVVTGQVYRSAQLSDQSLRHYIGQYGIKTVINLRGANPGEHWYDNELATSRALGLNHVDFRMSAKRDLSQQQAEELIAMMAAAPKPLLIHCASGADRTGLASALYLASIVKAGEDVAEAQLSIRYGHIALPFLPAYAMTRSWERFEPWLGYDS